MLPRLTYTVRKLRNEYRLHGPLITVIVVMALILLAVRGSFLTLTGYAGVGIQVGTEVECTSNTALVLLAHDREEYLTKTLESVRSIDGLSEVCVLISVDNAGFMGTVTSLLQSSFPHLSPLISVVPNYLPPTGSADDAIRDHHRKVFETVFEKRSFQYAIILETDLTVSRDFLSYFLNGREYLSDPTSNLFCISAWNDNGFNHLVLREDRLLRTSFFPGLGWMLARFAWINSLKPDWPSEGYGYDWYLRRHPIVSQLECIIPEVSRSHHIAKDGAHVNGNGHLVYDRMVLANGDVSIPESEWKIVANRNSFEQRIRNELFNPGNHKLYEAIDNVDYFVPFSADYSNSRSKHFIVIARSGRSDMKTLLNKFRLYRSELRGDYRGVLSVHVRENDNRVTIVTSRRRTKWIPIEWIDPMPQKDGVNN